MVEKSTILIIDDHPLLRCGIKNIISLESSLLVVGDTSDGMTGVILAEEKKPDIILLDMNMSNMNGLEILDILIEKEISGRIIFFTVSNNKEDIINALQKGADGYLLKDMEPEKLLSTLKEAANGKIVISPELTTILAESIRLRKNRVVENLTTPNLTPRETYILKLIAEGLPNKTIARKLDISDNTVKVHVKHLLKKLNLKSRVEAVIFVHSNNNNE